MAKHLSTECCSPKRYWRGKAALMNLAPAAKVCTAGARDWLTKKAVWQICLPMPRHIPRQCSKKIVPTMCIRPTCDNYLIIIWAARRRSTPVIDVRYQYIGSEHAAELAAALGQVYKRGSRASTWPRLLQVDPWCEFMGAHYDVAGGV